MGMTSKVLGPLFVLCASATNAYAADASIDSGTCGSGLACEQCDTSGYSPVEMQKPIGPNAAMCSDADISAFVTACGFSGTQTTCSAGRPPQKKRGSGC